ncbi:sterol desaturase family protein [Vibrio sp. RC27]
MMLESQQSIRLGVFLTVLVVMMVIEAWRPARQSKLSASTRWLGNFSLIFVASFVAKFALPAGAVGAALFAAQNGWGLFNVMSLPFWFICLVSVVLLDMAIYWQHRVFHTNPVLWRLHKVHHADSHIDVSSGLRFHPIEITLSVFYKAILVLLLGIPWEAVLIFEVMLNGFALFNHANIRLAPAIERPLSWLIITQKVHRIHHSQLRKESDSNFGFSISAWDRIFGSYCDKAELDDEHLEIGQRDIPDNKEHASLWYLLIMPFKK